MQTGKGLFDVERMKSMAASRGGDFVSGQYLGNKAKHSWRCAEGHAWETMPANIQKGSWCPDCAGRRPVSIGDLRQWAAKHGGRCLDESYRGPKTKHQFECSSGHAWLARPEEVRKGLWCAKCTGRHLTGNRAERLAQVCAFAASRGGRCLETEYKDNKAHMRLECAEGHAFAKTYNRLFSKDHRAKGWCPVCQSESHAYDAKEFESLVAAKGGKLTPPLAKPVQYSSRIGLSCGQGHEWTTEAGRVMKGGQWCPQCAKAATGPRLDVQAVRAICAKRGGELLSGGFKTRTSKIACRCAKGHEWLTTPFGLQYSESWCHACVDEARGNSEEEKAALLARLSEKALALGGRCLSSSYTNSNDRYEFVCAKGHAWSAAGKNVLNMDSWCPECAGKAGETFAVEYARRATGDEYRKIRPDWLVGERGRPLEIDAYSAARQIGIEYQGQQHYQFVELWHKNQENFEACLARDQFKRELCAANGVILFELKYIPRPTQERIVAHAASEAQSMAIPARFNPAFARFEDVLAKAEGVFAAMGLPEMGRWAKPVMARALSSLS
jgi:hypothetical protein